MDIETLKATRIQLPTMNQFMTDPLHRTNHQE